MLDIQRVLNQDRSLWALTGLNRRAFEALLETFSLLYKQTRQTQPRQRAYLSGAVCYLHPNRWIAFLSKIVRTIVTSILFKTL